MASLFQEKGGRSVVQFVGVDRKRRSLRLGSVTKRQAEAVKGHVEELLAARRSGVAIGPGTAAWVEALPNDMCDRLSKVGLMEERAKRWTVAKWVRRYIEGRTDIQDSSRCNLEQAERTLIELVGTEKRLTELTAADGDAYEVYLRGKGLKESTVRRQCGRVKQFLNAAVRAKVLKENPFSGLKSGDVADRSRDHEVTAAEITAILAHCPDAEWRVIVGLAYYAGLRVPSEIVTLRWADVDWGGNTLGVRSSKTHRASDGGFRRVPMCPELQKLVLAWYEQAEEGAEKILSGRWNSKSNLRTNLQRIMKRSGVPLFGKPWQNMRATCETNWLACGIPESQVSEWIGHQVQVGRRHYHQNRQVFVEVVTRSAAKCGAVGEQKALHKVVQQEAAEVRMGTHCARESSYGGELCEKKKHGSAECDTVPFGVSPGQGLEP